MAIVFDGKEFAAGIEAKLKLKIARLNKKPKLVSICNPQDPGGRMYTKIKAAKAEQLGVEFQMYDINSTTDSEGLVVNLNKDPGVDGLMIQMPLSADRAHDTKLCQLIALAKDVDGLNPASGVVPATVRGVIEILEFALKTSPAGEVNVAVVGGEGIVGRALTRQLATNSQFTIYNLDKYNFDAEKIKPADVVISATGQENLIKPEFVREGVIAIDVGFPRGDFDPEVVKKAAFFTPVPGGVGPVTVTMLFMNLVDLVSGKN